MRSTLPHWEIKAVYHQHRKQQGRQPTRAKPAQEQFSDDESPVPVSEIKIGNMRTTVRNSTAKATLETLACAIPTGKRKAPKARKAAIVNNDQHLP